MTSPMAEVIESCTDTAKDLLHKWRTYGSGVATKLDRPYDADTAAADLGTAVSLAVETGARLSFEALNALAILTGDYDEPVKSVKLSTQYKGAKLEWKTDLKNLFGDIVPKDKTTITPAELGSEETTFTVRADTTGCRAGIYEGSVRASTPDDEEEVIVRIEVP